MGTAVITGGASGFGLALARRAGAQGFDVVLADRDGERAETEAAALADAHDVTAVGLAVDVADAASVEAAAATVGDRFGRVDLLVSNVGVQLFGTVEAFTDEEWSWLLDVNVTGTARVVRSFLPLLRAADEPRMAFTTSSSVLDPSSRLAAYQASKFAVWGLAETLRLELVDEIASITVVFPSGMLTRHLESSEEAQPDGVRRPVFRDGDLEAVAASNPDMTSALAMPEDAAEGVVEAILAGEPYVVTHGDLTGAVARRHDRLLAAAKRVAQP